MGHRVELDEVDRAGLLVPGITACCSVYNEEKEQIWLFYTGEAVKRDIILKLRDILPGFMVPRKIQALDSIPKLPNGKYDFTSLKKMTQGREKL